MNRYLKLAQMELSRFWKMYAALCVMILLSQTGGLYLALKRYMTNVQMEMYRHPVMTYEIYANEHGQIRFETAAAQADFWFVAPIFLSIIALLIYVFFIWYRDWFGKNTFVYRLLMLPGDRMNLLWAKLTAIMSFVLGLVALQLALLPLYYLMLRGMVPDALVSLEPIPVFIQIHPILQVLVPSTFADFVLYYGAGLMGVTVLFTAVLLERSFRLRGLIAGVIYTAGALWLMLLPLLTEYYEGGISLYPVEAFLMELSLGLVLLLLSLGISRYLLQRKISV